MREAYKTCRHSRVMGAASYGSYLCYSLQEATYSETMCKEEIYLGEASVSSTFIIVTRMKHFGNCFCCSLFETMVLISRGGCGCLSRVEASQPTNWLQGVLM